MIILLRAGAIALALLLCAPLPAQSYDPTKDRFGSFSDQSVAQCSRWAAVTPSDTTDLAEYPKAIYAGVGGDIVMIGMKASAAAAGVTWKAVPQGVVQPVRPRRILATGTTATNIVACY
jgi:hypothetical protein